MTRDDVDALVERARRGDRGAFAQLFRRHRGVVAGIVYRMLGPGPDLEDVVQEVFLQVHRSLPDFRNQAKFSTWLHRVAVNVVLMHRRRARSRPVYTFGDGDATRMQAEHEALPDQDLARQRRIEALHRLLDRLSEKKRTVFVLHELEGLSPSEIAEQVGCPVLTVRTRLFYARRELTEMMRSEPALASVVREHEHGRRRGSAELRTDDAAVAPSGTPISTAAGAPMSAHAASDD